MPSILQPERFHPFPKVNTNLHPNILSKRTRSSSLNSNGSTVSDAELLIQFLNVTPAKSLPLNISLQIFQLANFSVSRAVAIASLVAEDPPSPSYLASDPLATDTSGYDTSYNTGRVNGSAPLRTRRRAVSVAESIASMPETDPLVTDASGVEEENHVREETEQKKRMAKEAARKDPNPLSRDPFVHQAKLDETTADEEQSRPAATGTKRRHSRAADAAAAAGSYGASVHGANESGKPVDYMPAADGPVGNADGIEVEEAAKDKDHSAPQSDGKGDFVAAAI